MSDVKNQKPKGPIRWEAIVPFFIVIIAIGLYFTLFFDRNMKSAIEFVGYKVIGAEVNLGEFKTSFTKASLIIKNLEITDAIKPTHNSLSIGEIRYSLLWDALLRAKFVVNEMAIEQIEFGKPRTHRGKVKPPEPPPPPSNEKPSFVEKEAEKLKTEALNKAQSKYNNNLMGDIAALLGGGDSNTQAQKIEGTLASKSFADKLEKELASKQEDWKKKLASLPQGKEFQSLGDRLNKVKIKDFKSIDEFQNSLKELDSLFKEADSKIKQITTASGELNSELKTTQEQIKELEQQVQNDIKNLESRFRIPSLDAKAISYSIFRRYSDPYLSKVNQVKTLAEKYLPPNIMKKDNSKEPEIAIQPKPRDKGLVYEFGRPNSYPLFWIKRIAISSKAGASPYSGDISGEVTDITSNQVLTGKPTIMNVAGDFPSAEIIGFSAKLSIDNRKEASLVSLDSQINSFPVEPTELVTSDELKLGFEKASAKTSMKMNLVGLSQLELKVNNEFSKIIYSVSARNDAASSSLKQIFTDIPVVTLALRADGKLPDFALAIDSNLGGEIEKGVQKQIQAKIKEAREKLEKYVNEQVGPQKEKIEAQYKQIKDQIDGELKKLNDQANGQKKMAENKSDQAKKESENQAKKGIEKDAQKAAEDLKKKFGL